MKTVQDKMRYPTVYEVFKAHRGRQIDKWEHYFPIYEKHFAAFVGKPVKLLEIGVDHGGSLQMWKEYFGPLAQITGVDINPACAAYTEPQISVIIADQRSQSLDAFGDFDIVIDDGSHVCAHQSITFRNLWPRTKSVYLIEDCHNGYPLLEPHPEICTRYPWIVVVERPKRIIRGTPSRELRPDEVEARNNYAE